MSLLVFVTTIFGISFNLILTKNRWYVPMVTYIYLAFPFYILIFLNNYYLNGKNLILWIFVVVWASDTSAFVFGKLLKGKKLMPSISPNKTWSGFVASIVCATIISIIFSKYLNITSLLFSFIIGIILSLSTSLGDLFESYLKRINNQKDVSKIIPGHGGLLDRLDGSLFAIVAMYIIILFGGVF